MKQNISLLLILFMVLLLSVFNIGVLKVEAASQSKYFVSGQLFYKKLSGDKLEVCGVKKNTKTLIIPSKVTYNGKTYTVTKIADYDPYDHDATITEKNKEGSYVDIDFPTIKYYRYDRTDGKKFPSGIFEFSEAGIEKIVFPSTLTYIGEGAFYGCKELKSISFAKKYKKLTIGKKAFLGKKVKSITFPEGTYELKENATGCIPSIKIPSTVKKIGPGVVNYNTKKVIISKKNKKFKMKNGILYTKNEKKLINASAKVPKNVKISEKTTAIGERAFAKTKVQKVTLNSKIKSIPKAAFAGCEKLVSVTGMENVTQIDYAAFWECKKLKSIGEVSKLNKIARASFWETPCLSLNLSATIQNIDTWAFSGINHGMGFKINIPTENPYFVTEGGFLIKKEKAKRIVMMQMENIEKVVVPEGVTDISVEIGGNRCKEIILPTSLKVQGGDIYTKMGTVIYKSIPAPTFEDDIVVDAYQIYVPKGCLEEYKKKISIVYYDNQEPIKEIQ